MAEQQPLNATFFAFRKRERGGVLLGASLAYGVLAFAVSGLFAWLNWHAMVDYFAWSLTAAERQEAIDPNDPNSFVAAMMPPPSVMAIVPSYMLLYFLIYLLLAAYEAACLRWLIRGEVKGVFGLTLDADTLRVYFTYWLWFFLFLAMYFVFVLLAVGIIFAVAMTAQSSGGDMGPAAAFLPLITMLAVLFGLIYFGVRFAPAAATSIAKRRFAFFDAWTVTKGRFWALLGSFALVFLMMVVACVVLVLGFGFAMGAGVMEQLAGSTEPRTTDEVLALFASPSVWIPVAGLYAFMIVGVFVLYLALFGINARAAQAALEDGRIQAAA